MTLTLKMLSFPGVFKLLPAFATRNLGEFCCWSLFLLPPRAVLLLLDAEEDVVSVLVPKELAFVFVVIIIVSIGEKMKAKRSFLLHKYQTKHFTMTINDHDQFTGLNAVHVAASEGNVKRLVELMDDGAELDVPALGGTVYFVCFYGSVRLYQG